MAILSRPRFLPQQRLDLEDVNALLAALRTDSKLYTKQFLSGQNLIYKGFNVSGIGLKSATVAMADATLIIPQSSVDFSWFIAAPAEPNITIPDADLTDGTRNYVEIELATENNTPLTKAFWDPEANSGLGSEFNQIVETITDLKVNMIVSTGGFSGSPDRLPLCIIDVDGSGNIKTILDRRILFGRLAIPANIDNEFSWGTKLEPAYALTLDGVSGTFQADETITIGTETAKVTTGGTTAIAFNVPSGINFFPGDTVTGQTSGATGTINTVAESFTGVDKNLKCQKDINDALMTELKVVKGTRFWWENAGSSIIGVVKFLESILVQATPTAKFAWDGSELKITDDNGTPGNDVLGYIRMMGRGDDIELTREDGTGGTSAIAIADREVLYVKVPATGDRTFSAVGAGSSNYQVIDIAAYQSSDENYWLAYREGTRLYIRGYGELEPGEEINIGDPELEDILAAIAANLASANQDRTMKLIEGGTWSLGLNGTSLTLSSDAFIEIPGLVNARNRIAAQTISLPNANSVAYVTVNRSGATPAALTVTVADADSISPIGNDVVIIARKVSAGVLVGAHSFLLKAGEYLELDGALAEINRYMGQLKIKRHESDLDKARINGADSLLLNGTTLSQVIGNFLLDFGGAVIDFTTGDIFEADGTTPLGAPFTPQVIPAGEYFWYGISLLPGDVNAQNMQEATVQVDLSDASDAVQADAPKPVISGTIKLGAILVRNNGGNIEIVDLKPLGVGSGSGGGNGQGASFDAELRTYLKLSPYEFVEANLFPVDEDDKIDPSSTGAYSPATRNFEMADGQTLVSADLLDPDFISANRPLAKVRVILRYAEGMVDSDPTVEISKNGGAYEEITMNRIGNTDTYDGELELDAADGTALVMRVTASEDCEVFGYGVMYDTTFTSIPLGQEKHIHPVTFSGDDNETTFTLPFLPDPSTLVIYDKTRGQSYIYDPGNTFSISGNDIVFVADFFNFPGETIRLEFRQIVGNGFDNSDQNANAIAALEPRILDVEVKGMNYAQNSEFRFWQRQTPGTLTNRQDDQYSADRWYVLTSGGAVNVQGARVEDSPTTSPTRYCGQFRQSDATSRRFGIAQILEADRVWSLRGKTVTFGFKVKADSGQIPNLRAGIVEWAGTADSVTSDIVSVWGSTPSLIANASFVSTITDISMDGEWVEFSVTATLGTLFRNLILFVWTPDEVVQNSDFFITQIQLVRGNSALDWSKVQITKDQDLIECQKFYEKSYNINVVPGTITAEGAWTFTGPVSAPRRVSTPMKVPKRSPPSVVFYSPATGAIGVVNRDTAGDTAINFNLSGETYIGYEVSSFPAGETRSYVQWTAEAEL